MPYLLKDLADGVVIPFSSSETAANIALSIFTLVSVLADSLAIYALLKQRSVPLDSRFIVSIITADFLFGLVCVIIQIINGKLPLLDAIMYSSSLYKFSIIRRMVDRQSRYFSLIGPWIEL